jgi:hypothetical protein
MGEESKKPVEAALRRYRVAQRRLNRKGLSRHEARTIAKELYKAIADACLHYGSLRNLAGTAPENFPPDMATWLYHIFANAVAGHRTESFEDLFSKGAPSWNVRQQMAVEIACRYIHAAKTNTLQVHAPVRKVCQWFGVNRRTVEDWMAKFRKGNLPLHPEFENQETWLESIIEEEGAYFRRYGSGQAAILARSRKRPKGRN